jgi:hypothetical protein
VAVETAAETLRDLRVAEVIEQDLHMEEGKVVAYRVRSTCVTLTILPYMDLCCPARTGSSLARDQATIINDDQTRGPRIRAMYHQIPPTTMMPTMIHIQGMPPTPVSGVA